MTFQLMKLLLFHSDPEVVHTWKSNRYARHSLCQRVIIIKIIEKKLIIIVFLIIFQLTTTILGQFNQKS